jgi:hypothetical protein
MEIINSFFIALIILGFYRLISLFFFNHTLGMKLLYLLS